MTLSRRSFLAGVSLALASGCAARATRQIGGARSIAPERRRPDDSKPHYVLLIQLRGGFDSVLSIDPKDQSVVGDGIYCGYRADERRRGALRLYGPVTGGLERHDRDLCFLNGVRSDTVGHNDGYAMLERGSNFATESRSIGSVIGANLPGDAPRAYWDISYSVDAMLRISGHEGHPSELTRERLRPPTEDDERLDRQRLAWSQLMNEEHIRAVQGLAGVEDGFRTGYIDALQEATILDPVLTAAMAGEQRWPFSSPLSIQLAVALQALRSNAVRCIALGCPYNYLDSHTDHQRYQTTRLEPVLRDLATLIDALKAERNGFGSLLEQTTIAAYSELGRFPRLNGNQGKDHFPENAWILAGRGVPGGFTAGATDNHYRGLKIDFRTGQSSADHGRPLYLDSAFASLLEMVGIDATRHGYARDAALECLVASRRA